MAVFSYYSYSSKRLIDWQIQYSRLKSVSSCFIKSRIEPESQEKLQSAWKVSKLQDAAQKLQNSDGYKASTSIHDLMKQLLKVVQPAAEGSVADGKKKNKKRAADDTTPAKVNGKSASPAKKVKASSK